MLQTINQDDEGRRSENIQTDYDAISAKLNQLPSFRFALVGFYLAAVGVSQIFGSQTNYISYS